MKIFTYCRVSKSNNSNIFGIVGTNSNIQIDECSAYCKKYCKDKGLKNIKIKVCTDEGTGRKGGNISSLRNILDDMESGDILVIYTIDRLSRNVLEGIKFLEDLTAKGCHIISVIDQSTYDKDDIYGRFNFRNRLNHAELESDRASERITRSIKNKRTSKKTISSTSFQCKSKKSKKRKSKRTQLDNDNNRKTKKVKQDSEPIVTITTNKQIVRNYFLRNTLEKYESNNSSNK